MISLLSYLHTCYIRSYRYVPPTFVFIVVIALVYSVVPNPVMSSYAFSLTFLFIISSVIGYTFIDIETSNQESVTLLHSRSITKLYVAKLLYCWLFTIPLALFALVYPVLTQSFDRNPTFEELGISFVFHTISSLLGVVVACWFSSKFIYSRLVSFLTLSLIIVITLAREGVETLLPDGIKKVMLLLPPLDTNINVLMNYESATLFMKLSAIGGTLIYILILAVLYLFVLNKRKFL